MNLKEQQENYELLYDTVKSLSNWQGFYSGYLRALEELTEY